MSDRSISRVLENIAACRVANAQQKPVFEPCEAERRRDEIDLALARVMSKLRPTAPYIYEQRASSSTPDDLGVLSPEDAQIFERYL